MESDTHGQTLHHRKPLCQWVQILNDSIESRNWSGWGSSRRRGARRWLFDSHLLWLLLLGRRKEHRRKREAEGLWLRQGLSEWAWLTGLILISCCCGGCWWRKRRAPLHSSPILTNTIWSSGEEERWKEGQIEQRRSGEQRKKQREEKNQGERNLKREKDLWFLRLREWSKERKDGRSGDFMKLAQNSSWWSSYIAEMAREKKSGSKKRNRPESWQAKWEWNGEQKQKETDKKRRKELSCCSERLFAYCFNTNFSITNIIGFISLSLFHPFCAVRQHSCFSFSFFFSDLVSHFAHSHFDFSLLKWRFWAKVIVLLVLFLGVVLCSLWFVYWLLALFSLSFWSQKMLLKRIKLALFIPGSIVALFVMLCFFLLFSCLISLAIHQWLLLFSPWFRFAGVLNLRLILLITWRVFCVSLACSFPLLWRKEYSIILLFNLPSMCPCWISLNLIFMSIRSFFLYLGLPKLKIALSGKRKGMLDLCSMFVMTPRVLYFLSLLMFLLLI